MKILFLCHRLPFPPKRGGKIRPFNIIRHLTESGHSVTVGSLARSEREVEEGLGLRDYCEKVLVGRVSPLSAYAQMILRLPSLSPSSMGYFYSKDLHRAVANESARNDFDLVFVHCSSAAQYANYVHRTPRVLDFGDMDSQKWLDYSGHKRFPLSAGYWLEGTKLCRAEKKLAQEFDLCTCTTLAELRTLDAYGVTRTTDWFPNGVDLEYFRPQDEPYDEDTICFVGRMDYYPNQQAMQYFCTEALPLIRDRRPSTKLVIVGADPSPEIRRLGLQPGVTVTGTVDDVRSYVQSSALTVAPLSIARGTQNKILESMAMGVPVISSSQAAGGVDAISGQHILVADSVTEIVERCISMLGDPDLRQRYSLAGRARVASHHNWSASLSRLEAILDKVV